MTISADQVTLLNTRMGSIARKVQLGTLIQNAESIVASEVALADGLVLIGNVSGIAAAKSLSGAITISREGVATLGADAVSGADKIADDAVSAEHLDDGVLPSHVVKFAGKHTTAGGDATEVITVTGLLTTDVVHVSIQTKGATPRTIVASVLTADTITVEMSGDPSTDHILSYSALRAVV